MHINIHAYKHIHTHKHTHSVCILIQTRIICSCQLPLLYFSLLFIIWLSSVEGRGNDSLSYSKCSFKSWPITVDKSCGYHLNFAGLDYLIYLNLRILCYVLCCHSVFLYISYHYDLEIKITIFIIVIVTIIVSIGITIIFKKWIYLPFILQYIYISYFLRNDNKKNKA